MGKKNRNQRKQQQNRSARQNLQSIREEAQRKEEQATGYATDTPLEGLSNLKIVDLKEEEPNPQEHIEVQRSMRKTSAPAKPKKESAPKPVQKKAEPKKEDFDDEPQDTLQVGPFAGVIRDGHFDKKTGELTAVSILAKNPINGNPQIYTGPAEQLPENFDLRPNAAIQFQLKRGRKGNIIAHYVEYIKHDVIESAAVRALNLVNKLDDAREEQSSVVHRWTPAMLQAALLIYLQDNPEEKETDPEKLLDKAGYMLVGTEGNRFVLVEV